MVVSSSNPHSKEISIRRRIASIFNKREEDFSSLKEYNDYLEEVEDMTFNLIEGIDVPAIEAKIAEYEKENHDQIMINRARKLKNWLQLRQQARVLHRMILMGMEASHK